MPPPFNVVERIDKFPNVAMFLHLWDKTHLVMNYYSFTVIL